MGKLQESNMQLSVETKEGGRLYFQDDSMFVEHYFEKAVLFDPNPTSHGSIFIRRNAEFLKPIVSVILSLNNNIVVHGKLVYNVVYSTFVFLCF